MGISLVVPSIHNGGKTRKTKSIFYDFDVILLAKASKANAKSSTSRLIQQQTLRDWNIIIHIFQTGYRASCRLPALCLCVESRLAMQPPSTKTPSHNPIPASTTHHDLLVSLSIHHSSSPTYTTILTTSFIIFFIMLAPTSLIPLPAL